MLELGLSGSVRGVPSNAHPYRDPGPTPAIRDTRRDRLNWVETRHSRFARKVMPRLESRHSGPEAATPLAGRKAEEYPRL
jgi:hypothetical protein